MLVSRLATMETRASPPRASMPAPVFNGSWATRAPRISSSATIPVTMVPSQNQPVSRALRRIASAVDMRSPYGLPIQRHQEVARFNAKWFLLAMAVVRIALANIPYADSPDDSVDRAERAIAEAAREKAAIVAFPESYIPGYRGECWVRPAADPAFLENAWSRMEKAAARAKITVALGTERHVDGKARISILVINPDGTRAGWQDKVQLDPSEDADFEPGTERQVFDAGPLRFGFSICHEGFRYPETVRWSAKRGAHVV